MFGFSPLLLIFILVIAFVIFGGIGKLPEIGSGIGKAIKNFKNSVSGKDEIDVTPANQEDKTAPKPKRKQLSRSGSAVPARKRKTPSKSARPGKKA